MSIPGETLAPSGTQRQIRDRIYAHARSVDPQCSQQAITNTEVLELHPGGRVAEERWTLELPPEAQLYRLVPPRRTRRPLSGRTRAKTVALVGSYASHYIS